MQFELCFVIARLLHQAKAFGSSAAILLLKAYFFLALDMDYSFMCVHLRIIFLSIVVTTFSYSINAQVSNPQLQITDKLSHLEEDDKWNSYALLLTSKLKEDLPQMEEMDRAILLARLGEVWFKQDRTQAGKWLLAAVEIVEKVPQYTEESASSRTRRIAAVREVFRTVTPLDQTLSDRLLKSLQSDSKNNAEALADAAKLAIDLGDVKRGTTLWRASLQAGCREDRLITLLIQIRKLDSNTADLLFGEALALAPSVSDHQYYWALVFVAFPETQNPSLKSLTPPDSLRVQTLFLHDKKAS